MRGHRPWAVNARCQCQKCPAGSNPLAKGQSRREKERRSKVSIATAGGFFCWAEFLICDILTLGHERGITNQKIVDTHAELNRPGRTRYNEVGGQRKGLCVGKSEGQQIPEEIRSIGAPERLCSFPSFFSLSRTRRGTDEVCEGGPRTWSWRRGMRMRAASTP